MYRYKYKYKYKYKYLYIYIYARERIYSPNSVRLVNIKILFYNKTRKTITKIYLPLSQA